MQHFVCYMSVIRCSSAHVGKELLQRLFNVWPAGRGDVVADPNVEPLRASEDMPWRDDSHVGFEGASSDERHGDEGGKRIQFLEARRVHAFNFVALVSESFEPVAHRLSLLSLGMMVGGVR